MLQYWAIHLILVKFLYLDEQLLLSLKVYWVELVAGLRQSKIFLCSSFIKTLILSQIVICQNEVVVHGIHMIISEEKGFQNR